jgi:rhomboid family GlyGly-CTERM serine protease
MKTTFLLVVVALAAALLPGRLLELQRGGEPWRVITCHFTHWTYEQLAWDGLVFAALGVACARRNRQSFHATLLASVICVPIGVLAFAPGIDTYRGLSGIDSALFALLLVTEVCRRPVRQSFLMSAALYVCAAAFFGKIAFETITGAAVFVQDMGPGVVSVPVAHVIGALIGALIAAAVPSPRLRGEGGRRPDEGPLTRRFAPPSPASGRGH